MLLGSFAQYLLNISAVFKVPGTRIPGPWTLDPGPWTLDPGPWTLDPIHLTFVLVVVNHNVVDVGRAVAVGRGAVGAVAVRGLPPSGGCRCQEVVVFRRLSPSGGGGCRRRGGGCRRRGLSPSGAVSVAGCHRRETRSFISNVRSNFLRSYWIMQRSKLVCL
jgi:hypothetical protein